MPFFGQNLLLTFNEENRKPSLYLLTVMYRTTATAAVATTPTSDGVWRLR